MGEPRNIKGLDVTKQDQIGEVIVWKANQPLTAAQHKIVGEMLRREEKATGMRIMLIPYSVDAIKTEAKTESGDAPEE